MGKTLILDRRLLLVAAVPVVLWLGLLVAAERVFWSLVFDDSFYYWQIARKLASGAGSTFDGLNQTNGYHPLWMLFCVGLYGLGLGGELAPRVAVGVQVVLYGVALWALGAAVLRLLAEVAKPARRGGERLALGVLLVAGCVQPLVKVWVNGLESTFVLVFQVLLLALMLRTPDLLKPGSRGVRLVASVLLALAFLARTDGALLLPAVAVWALPMLWRDFRGTWRPLLELLVVPTVIVVAYMVTNQVLFGSAVQVSGLLKSPSLDPWRLAATLAVIVLPVLAARRIGATGWPHLARTLARTAPFGLFALFVTAYYGVLSAFPRSWYFGPVVLYLVLLAACGLADLAARAQAESGVRGVRTLAAILGVVGLVGVVFGVQQALSAPAAAPLLANRAAGRYIAAELPADAVLASWDAGVLGYYAERPVVNLDGVVNSALYLSALRNGTTAAYLADLPIGWVANHATDEGSLQAEAVAYLGERAAHLEVVRTWPFEVFAGVNQVVPTGQSLQVILAALR